MNGNEGHIERHSVDEARLDVTIDTVAREMTEGEPSGALRARVLERIEQGRRHAAPRVPRWAWAGAAAAAALAVATAVWVVSPLRNQDAAQSTMAGQRAAVPPPASSGTERAAAEPAVPAGLLAPPESAPAAAARTSRAAATQEARPAEVEAAEVFDAVPALPEIEPLRLASVEPAPLHIADMEIAPIPEMPSIEIPSLDSGPHDIQIADPKKEK